MPFRSNNSEAGGGMLSRFVGNDALKTSVAQMFGNQRMTHSLLLCGEAGVGARFAARLLAAQYLYPQGGAAAEAMARGEACLALAAKGGDKVGTIQTGIVREALIVSGDGKADTIKVSQIRAVRREIVNSSLSAEGRVVLIYGAEKMQQEAANALLKILEEPPEGVLFLLTATSLAAVLPTIRSRCVAFALAPPTVADCTAFCVGKGIAQAQAASMSEIFGGHIGTVLAVSQDVKRKNGLKKAVTLAKATLTHDAYSAGALLAAYEKDKPGAILFLTDFISLCFAGMHGSSYSPLKGDAALGAIRAAQQAIALLQSNVNTKATLTQLAIQLGKGTL